jgi:mono/diheme cytochrome c family protein
MRKMRSKVIIIIIGGVLGVSAGCGSVSTKPRPTATPARPPDLSWDASIGALLNDRCASCHGNVAGISYSTYQSTLQGSMHGPIIIPGDPVNSKLVVKQTPGNHPGQLSAEQLARVEEWIRWGAPEK